jgi:structural hemagglutinin/hemolysin toxin protein RtxA
MYKISVYVPELALEIVKAALFQAGAGTVGNYSHCAWQVLGEGQFMPLEGSQPFIGTVHQVEKVREYRLEVECDEAHIHAAIAALKEAHPYEVPAYEVVRCEAF